MTNEKNANGDLLPDYIRLTKFGELLRSTSLDELFSILKGDMSMVGPRPLLVEYLPLYSTRQRRRHEVRPGLSGLAQFNGRNAISWEEEFQFDVQYVDNINFGGDIKIIPSTFKKAIIRQGINSDNAVTVDPLQGSDGARVDL